MQPTGLPDVTNMTASQLGNQAVQAINSPDVQSAQNDVNSAMTEANTQKTDQATLPQLLENSLTSNLDNPNDPNRQQTQGDLASLLTTLSNPSSAISDAQETVPGAILSPGAQREAIAQKVGNAGARLSMDNLILGARGAGITGIVGMFSNAMAARTQQLLDKVQLAQNNRDMVWNKAQALGAMAMNFSQIKQQMDEFNKNFGLQEKQFEFEKSTNPLLAAQQGMTALRSTAKGYKTFDDFYGAAKDNPALAGMSDQDIYALYKSNGGKGSISTQLQRQTGIRTGNITQDIVGSPNQAAQIGGEAIGKAASIAPFIPTILDLFKGLPGAENVQSLETLLPLLPK